MRNFIDIVRPLFENIVLDEVAPSDQMTNATYYHGTKSDANGLGIMKTGLQPGNTGQSRGLLTPVSGKTYFTADLTYAIMYTIGGNMLGCSEDSVKHLTKDSRFGWLFVIDGKILENDMSPDEDSVGEAVMFAHRIINKPNDSLLYIDNSLCKNLMAASKYQVISFLDFAKRNMTQKQFKDALDGFISAQASGGKRLLKVMSDDMKRFLIHAGAHVAYTGPITPNAAYRFDKNLTPKLLKDGSNFFDLAEKVR